MNGDQDRFEDEESRPNEEFARMLEQFESTRASGTPSVGSKVRGRIVQIGETTCFVDFGGRSEGAMELDAFRDADGNVTLQIGDVLDLFVVDDKDEILLAPSLRAEPSAALSQMQDARRAGMPVTGRVTGMNAGGLEVDVAGLRGFCPASQIEAAYCADPSVFVGRTLEFLVTELADGGKRFVVSRKALLRREEEEKRRRLLAELKPGQEMDGTVARIEAFGAFVDLGGVDGLVHVSEISHARIDHPQDVLHAGQQVRVKVLDLKEAVGGRTKISLSIKAAEPDPWHEVSDTFTPGRVVSGTVARLTDFGAFVTLSPGIDGLVHVSEIALRPVAHPREALQVGVQVGVKILSVEPDRRRISLSIRDVLAAEAGEGAGGTGDAGAASTGEAKVPTAGDVVDAWVAGIKPYGLFVDLPGYGHRARALVPAEETGERRGTDLTKRYRIGDQLRVEIVDVNAEGKVRASMTRAAERSAEEQFQAYKLSTEPKRAPETAMGEALRRAMEDAEKKKGA
jgi:small subunit ribosomal protein S1